MRRNSRHQAPLAVLVAIALLAACGSSATDGEASRGLGQGDADHPSARGGAPLDRLTIQGPNNVAISGVLTDLIDAGQLDGLATQVEFVPFNTPEEMKARITARDVQASVLPTTTGAVLHNRGVDVRLLNVAVWGLLSLIGPDGGKVDWASLRGEKIYVPFRNEIPDLIFTALSRWNGLEPGSDVTLEYVGSPAEASALLAAGRGRYAVLPEPFATLAVEQARKGDAGLDHVMNLQEEWAVATGSEPRIPQAGVLVDAELAASHPEVVARIHEAMARHAEGMLEDPAAAARRLAERFRLPEGVVAAVLPRLDLDVVPAAEARHELEVFYRALGELRPESIGGRLPEGDFYLELGS